MLLNLVSNSLKFTNRNGKIDINIEKVKMEPKHKNKNNTQELKISVKDDGIGIKT